MTGAADRGFRHGFRGPLNAWLLAALDRYMDAKYGERKRALFGGGPEELIVELGPGTGANLRYFGRGARVVAIEPNRAMHSHLREAARRRGIRIEVRSASAEATGLPDASADLIVASLVLCTVPDPRGAVAEARRILKPGGRFVCLEHVGAPPGTAEHRLQRLLRRPWRWLFEGCDLCRDTARVIASAGFREAEITPFQLDTVVAPIAFQIQAICVR